MLGFATGIGSIGIIFVSVALSAALRVESHKRKLAAEAAGSFKKAMAQATTAAMMNRDGESRH